MGSRKEGTELTGDSGGPGSSEAGAHRSTFLACPACGLSCLTGLFVPPSSSAAMVCCHLMQIPAVWALLPNACLHLQHWWSVWRSNTEMRVWDHLTHLRVKWHLLSHPM